MPDIEAFLFDLDGTLVQTERLKAISYARAALNLAPDRVREEDVMEAFKNVVGKSRHDVATYLLDAFDLRAAVQQQMHVSSETSILDAFIRLRLDYYHRMIADPMVIQKSLWLHNIEQLYNGIADGYQTALATMSHREQASRVLDILNLTICFDFIATRDDVEKGKPDPEIYHLVASSLEVEPEQCLVFEDSVSGVTAALAAGMHVIAVSTPFTRDKLDQANLLPSEQLVHDPRMLQDVVDRFTNPERSELAA